MYGALLIVAAMVGATLVWESSLGGWLRTSLLILAVPVALTGGILTFRDLSKPLPRSRRRPR